jgi:hypothetical protein
MQVEPRAPFGSPKHEHNESHNGGAPKTSGRSDFDRVQVVGVGANPLTTGMMNRA